VINVSAANLTKNVDDLLNPGRKSSFNNNRLLVTSERNQEMTEDDLFKVLDK